jgi:hypothetical protein
VSHVIEDVFHVVIGEDCPNAHVPNGHCHRTRGKFVWRLVTASAVLSPSILHCCSNSVDGTKEPETTEFDGLVSDPANARPARQVTWAYGLVVGDKVYGVTSDDKQFGALGRYCERRNPRRFQKWRDGSPGRDSDTSCAVSRSAEP